MKYRDIREQAFEANVSLPKLKLAAFTFGNVSAADKAQGVFAIKPSGVAYELLTPEKMVVVDFDGKVVDGNLRPSSDTLTHAVLYQHWQIGGICHTHSKYATAWAQSGRDIPVYGTTHADQQTNPVPCAPPMLDEMIKGNYERETGFQIMTCLAGRNLAYQEQEMLLVANHAPFSWGKTAEAAVYNSAVLELIAEMALLTEQLNPQAAPMKAALIQKHYERKHGKNKYYGQP